MFNSFFKKAFFILFMAVRISHAGHDKASVEEFLNLWGKKETRRVYFEQITFPWDSDEESEKGRIIADVEMLSLEGEFESDSDSTEQENRDIELDLVLKEQFEIMRGARIASFVAGDTDLIFTKEELMRRSSEVIKDRRTEEEQERRRRAQVHNLEDEC